ncbi:3'-5' exonuclease [Deinococcus cavernae]|uniref:3'-5' exonuclease n=1 Tax=Deinococcus cavernae TaxID=2320857 RepID=A0A418V9C6_9DEIO|nr:3'-5' exonuclease [Deinococcus cavernae]RJF72646.1 3'-5' exonuclease [Deinococcus cavernae]
MTWRTAEFVALDFEATGMNPARDEVIQVGLVPLRGERALLGGAWASWVRPTRPFQGASVAIHGLSAERLQDAPDVLEVRGSLAAHLNGRVMIAHYAELERGFLKRWGMKPPPTVDTLMLALALDGHLKGGQTTQTARRDAYTLTALARRFGVSVYGEHDALADALITAQVFLVIATELERKGRASTVKEFTRLSGYGGGWLGLFG